MITYGIVVHGGVGSSPRLSGACAKACAAGFDLLKRGAPALDAVVEAARRMENDGRFNAGSGSVLRLDGKTVEMDASLMDSDGRLGVVISVRNVRNPICLARAVTSTPHVAVSGEGATLLARRFGLKELKGVSRQAFRRYERMRLLIAERRIGEHDVRWKDGDIRSLWNFDVPYEEIFPLDTIGAVAIDGRGSLAVANSTGGASPMLLGRVGDTPMIGCGFYAGPLAAVAATGIGEEIMKRMLTKTVYDMIADRLDILLACDQGIRMFPHELPVGLIGISKTGYAVKSNRQMAHHALIEGQ